MRTIGLINIIIQGLVLSVCAQDRIRELFEWGEYDSLLIAVPEYCSGNGRAIDSTRFCEYFGYLGVAFFAKGNLADARGAFRQALECNADLMLDSQYVTPEMLNLFADTHREVAKERERERREDSLKAQAETQRKARERERAITEQRLAQSNELDGAFRKTVWVSAALLTLSAAGAGVAAYEYSVGREYDRDFRAAANTGDLREYERNRELLRRQNRGIIVFSTASVLSGCLASYFGFRCVSFYRARTAITLLDGSYGITLALDF